MAYFFLISIRRLPQLPACCDIWATKILAQGDGRKWGNHRGHKSALRHTSCRVWLSRTIDTATTWGHIHFCLSCGSQVAEANFDNIIVWKLTTGRIFFSSIRRQNSTCLFDLIYLVAHIWGESSNKSQVALQWFFFLLSFLNEGQKHRSSEAFLYSSKQPQCDCGPICSIMCSRPLQRWLSTSVAHSLWNLSCSGDSFHSPTQPKYHVPKMGNATCMQNFKKKKKTCSSDTFPVC